MAQFKKSQVILLPINNKSSIWSNKGRNLYYKQVNFNDIDDEIRYNIYVVSDDEIKDEDWCIIDKNKIGKRTNKQTYPNCIDGESHLCYYYIINGKEESYHISHCKKIIATTDISLSPQAWIGSIGYLSLPLLSEEFIEYYINQYNNKNIITDVLVEYNIYDNQCDGFSCNICDCNLDTQNIINELKLNSNNTIVIKPLKDSWNKEEVIELIKEAIYAENYDIYITRYPDNTVSDIDDESFNKWINKNL